jgi:hypothetical protein
MERTRRPSDSEPPRARAPRHRHGPSRA